MAPNFLLLIIIIVAAVLISSTQARCPMAGLGLGEDDADMTDYFPAMSNNDHHHRALTPQNANNPSPIPTDSNRSQ